MSAGLWGVSPFPRGEGLCSCFTPPLQLGATHRGPLGGHLGGPQHPVKFPCQAGLWDLFQSHLCQEGKGNNSLALGMCMCVGSELGGRGEGQIFDGQMGYWEERAELFQMNLKPAD